MLPVGTKPTVPVPVRAAVCGLLLALSTTIIEPLAAPTVMGLNITFIVQDAFDPREPKQLFI